MGVWIIDTVSWKGILVSALLTGCFLLPVTYIIQIYGVQGSSLGQFSVDIQTGMRSSTDSTPAWSRYSVNLENPM